MRQIVVWRLCGFVGRYGAVANSRPTLALVQPAESLRRMVEHAFGQVWSGRRVVTTISGTPGLNPKLAVVASARAPEAWRVARAIARLAPDVPIVAVVEGADRLRREGHVPRQVVWATSPDELENERLKMVVRYAIKSYELREAMETIRQLRVRDLGWLLSHVSHEVGNPLTTLVTNLEFVQANLSADSRVAPDVMSALYDARIAADHILRLNTDLRRASRQTPHVTSVDVSEVVDTARRLTADGLRGVTMQIQADPCPPVRVDETRMVQVFVNLLHNAGRALDGVDDPMVRLRISPQRREVVVQMSNNGPPITKDILPNLFNEGFTTHREGCGIGLALSRRYVQQMGGQLRLVSASPVCFEVRLPAMPRIEAPETLVPLRSGQGGRVLIVDDEPTVRRAIARQLKGRYEVDQAETAGEAIRFCAMQRYDLLLVDLHLRGETGLDVHRALVGQHGTVPPMVFVSGHFDGEELAYVEENRLKYAYKPLGVTSLRELVAELIGGGRKKGGEDPQ